MRTGLRVVPFVAALVFAGCPKPIVTPVATQPRLVGVRLVGHQSCTPLTTGGQQFTFTCPTLPTIEATGWVLTPGWTPSTTNPARQHLNRTATVTVSGPSLTEIDVELVRLGNVPNVKLASVDPNQPGKPGEVAAAKEVGVVAQDNGNGKTWNIDVNVSGCADFREIQVFNRSNNVRSSPLSVWLLRDPADEVCVGGGGGTFFGVSGGSSPGTPTSTKPPGPCAGGAAERLFNVCENCSFQHPPDAWVYTGFMACDWNEVLAVFGYSGPGAIKSQTCTIKETASREACEGPP